MDLESSNWPMMACDSNYTVTVLAGDWDSFHVPSAHIVGSNLWEVFDPVKYAELVQLYERVMKSQAAETISFLSIETGTNCNLHVRPSATGFVLLIEQIALPVADDSPQPERTSLHTDANQIDATTGLPNRVAIEARLAALFDKAKASRTPFSVLLIDIDDLEKINITLGRDVGDEVIRAFAREFNKTRRTSDFFGRFGGDDFVLTLSGEGIGQACRIAMRICNATPHYEGMPLSITISIGVASFAHTDNSWHIILKRAYSAHAQARRGRGNKVCTVTDDVHRAEQYFEDLPEPEPTAGERIFRE